VARRGKSPATRFLLVSSDGLSLTGLDAGLQVHFDGASLQKLGYRLADAYAGKTSGITSDRAHPRGVPHVTSLYGEPAIELAELVFQDNAGDPDDIRVFSGQTGVPVLFVEDTGGTVTRTAGETAGAGKEVILTVGRAARTRVRVYVNAAAALDNPVGLNVAAGDPPGDCGLRSLTLHPSAPLSQFYTTGASDFDTKIRAADLPRTMEVFRVQNCPKVDLTEFWGAHLPETLTLLNLSGCLIPRDVKDSIATENTARGSTISLQGTGNSIGQQRVPVFASITEMTDAVTDGFVRDDNAIAIVIDDATGEFDVLQAKAGTAATPSRAPAGWKVLSLKT